MCCPNIQFLLDTHFERATEIDFADLVDKFSEVKTNKEASLR